MAETREINGIKVNDGKGLYDTEGLIDSLIVDCNEAVRKCISGQAIGFCNVMVQIVQKLANVKNGYKNELAAKEEQIQQLNQLIDEHSKKLADGRDEK